MNKKRVAVLGLGYVGLPSAAVIARAGLEVLGVDIDASAVETINTGRAHIVEPGLDELLSEVVSDGRLKASTTIEPADVFVIAVPTPFHEDERKTPNLQFVLAATKMIAPVLQSGNAVILESTSPVGATEQVTQLLRDERPDLVFPKLNGEAGDISIAYCPERILPGNVINELVDNHRVVGGMTRKCAVDAVEFYDQFISGKCHVTDCRTAELCKLSENAFRDVNIAFANELSTISHRLGIKVNELIGLANRHPRVDILNPGPGVGGHCIAVDPWFIVDGARDEANLIRTAREVNDGKPHWVVQRIVEQCDAFESPVIACMGLAYKPNVDDLRESPSVEVSKLLADGKVGEILICEPYVDSLPATLSETDAQMVDIPEALDRADVIVFLTAHQVFHQIDPEILKGKVVIDPCGLTFGRVD